MYLCLTWGLGPNALHLSLSLHSIFTRKWKGIAPLGSRCVCLEFQLCSCIHTQSSLTQLIEHATPVQAGGGGRNLGPGGARGARGARQARVGGRVTAEVAEVAAGHLEEESSCQGQSCHYANGQAKFFGRRHGDQGGRHVVNEAKGAIDVVVEDKVVGVDILLRILDLNDGHGVLTVWSVAIQLGSG